LKETLFPYKFREFQEDFLNFIQLGVSKSKNIIVEAATGFGKTPLILSALIPKVIKKDLKIVWIAKTGSESDRPIEELKVVYKYLNIDFFGFSFRGKKDMCLLLKDLKLSNKVNHEEASLVCEAYRNKCQYRANLEEFNAFEWLIKEPRLYSEILNFCIENKVCPYKIQVLLLNYAKILALSYNYIIDFRINHFMKNKVGFKNSILIVDEAHNLQQAVSEVNSDKITIGTVERALKEAELLGNKDLEGFLDAMNGYLQKFLKSMKSEDALVQLSEIAWKCAGNESSFKEFCEEAKKAGNKLRRQRLLEGKAPRSSLHHLGEFWMKVIENINVEGVALTAFRENESLTIEFTDMRGGELLSKLWSEFNLCIFCSGTLKPLEAFAEIIGLNNYLGKVFPSPYSDRNVTSFITKGLSSKGEELTNEMAERYIKALEDFVKALNVNLAIFASSYRVQNKLLSLGLKEIIENHNREVFIEAQNMSGEEGRELMKKFKACAEKRRKGVLIGVMGGRFAEGADFPGKQLEAIFLAGIPFEKPTVKTQLYIKYYSKLYGEEKGRYYAYILPALKRASQALGRALRSKDDYAVMVLGDERYTRYLELLPDYIQKTVKTVNFEALYKALEECQGN